MRRPVLTVLASAALLAGGVLASQPASAATRPHQVGMVSFTAASYSKTPGRATLTLDWPSTSHTTKYEIYQSRYYSMAHARKFTSRASSRKMTRLARGVSYFYQVRAVNGSKAGSRSKRVGHTTIRQQGTSSGRAYQVMTFNVCSRVCEQDKKSATPKWSQRSGAAMGRILAYRPDVVALQEAEINRAPYVVTPPAGYAVAAAKSAKQLYYKTSRFDVAADPACGTGPDCQRSGSVLLGHHGGGDRWAVWAELVEKGSGKHTIFVDVHTVVGDSEARARERQTEIGTLLQAMKGINSQQLPVVYAGDFNSHKHRANDYLARQFHAAGLYDGFDLAQSFKRQHYNSFGGFSRTPITSYTWGDHVDHVWVTAARTRVISWANVAQYRGSTYTTPMPSDHNPLLVKVLVN